MSAAKEIIIVNPDRLTPYIKSQLNNIDILDLRKGLQLKDNEIPWAVVVDMQYNYTGETEIYYIIII